MEYFMMPTDKIASLQHFKKTEKDVIGGLCSLANIPLSPETAQDQERRIRREIANSNERRRMQSINAGFQSLKTLLPHTDGEKLSKAAILQQTSDYIFALEQEKTQLLAQNNQLKRFIQEFSGSSPKRRRAEEKDEGIGSPDTLEEEKVEEVRREMLELRQQLDKERSARMQLEEQVRSLNSQLQPERLKVITQQVEEEQALLQSQTLLRLQQIHAADRRPHSPQVLASPAPTPPRPHPPPHGHRSGPDTNPAPPPSRHRCDHEPVCPHRHRVHVQAEPGHYCAGHPAHRARSGEESERRGGAETSRHR
ncbi:transcription factor AP-4-like isoform X1 [Cebidichthys violaceus]|uniref:transcription factor AP-4-like isoform X1 n=1 Tax=Cebidichthys violaceus TaxID=271503 RepID=UPI0035CC56E2